MSKYELYSDVKGSKAARAALGKLISRFSKDYKALSKKYPDVGLGDTETDEAIVEEIYERIHWGG